MRSLQLNFAAVLPLKGMGKLTGDACGKTRIYPPLPPPKKKWAWFRLYLITKRRQYSSLVWRLLFVCHTPRKGIHDSLGFWILRRGFWVPGTGFQILCQWNLDFGLPSLVGFPRPWAESRIPESQDSRFHKQKFLGFRNLVSLAWGDVPTCFLIFIKIHWMFFYAQL